MNISTMSDFEVSREVSIELDEWHIDATGGALTMQLMLDNKIGLSPCIMQPDNDFEEPAEMWIAECGELHAYHKNPHRAVCEVFLMTKGMYDPS